MPFFNFDAAPRPSGWGEGQTGDTVEFPKDSSVDINNKKVGLSLIVFEQFSFKVTWGLIKGIEEVTFDPANRAVVGGANSKGEAQHPGPGWTCMPSLVEFGPAVCLETLTEQKKKQKNKKKKKTDRQRKSLLAFFP